jgi:hypothetical protein
MKTGVVLAMLLGLCCTAIPALGDRLELSPTPIVLLPTESSDTTRIVIEFDLSALPEDTRIDACMFGGTLGEIANDGSAAFAAYRVMARWNPELVASGSESVVWEDEPEATWDVSALDHERNGSFVRFDLTRLARAWHRGERGNYGVLIEGVGISAENLVDGLSELLAVVLAGR